MNVLFINIEDCAADVLGCYGNPLAHTPNLDRLAATGVRFDNAFCNFPLCNPSRASYVTGVRPETLGVTKNTHLFADKVSPETTTIFEIMNRTGRHTANFGKLLHHHEPRLRAFDEIAHCKLPPEPGEEPPQPKWGPEEVAAYHKQANRYGDSGRTPEESFEHIIYTAGANVIRRQAREGEAFFMSLGSALPHAPWICPAEYINRFDPEGMTDPEPAIADHRDVPAIEYRDGANFDMFQRMDPSPQQVREARAAYLACVSFVDSRIGIALDALEEAGMADKTVVIFTADQGMHRGEHGIFGKATLYDNATRVPLIVRDPRLPGGRTCGALVELVDILPSVCELTGVAPPEQCQGISFAPLLEDPALPWKSAIFSKVNFDQQGSPQGRGVRTQRYRYAEWDSNTQTFGWCQPETMYRALYDLEADPLETTNLMRDPAYADAASQMTRLLRQGWQAALPPGRA
jgi:uncharacterized sulfatase